MHRTSSRFSSQHPLLKANSHGALSGEQGSESFKSGKKKERKENRESEEEEKSRRIPIDLRNNLITN